MTEIDNRQMLPIGALLKQGEYRVERYIASGGFGNTYEVVHTRLNKHLAMKEFFMRGINQREGTRVSVSLDDNRPAFLQMREKFYKEVCQPLSGRPRELPRPSLFTDQVAKIKSIKEKIDTIVSAELAAKGLKACPDCENEVVLASKFCNMCGYRFPVRNEDKKMRPTPVPRCKQCGANLEPDSVFCPDCGKRQ